MYVNKCVKCGREFETKNPKRVICPDCLYPDKKMMITPTQSDDGQSLSATPESSMSQSTESGDAVARAYSSESQPRFYNSYSAGEERPRQPQRSYSAGGYSNNRQSGYRTGYQRRDNQGGYGARNSYSNNRQGSYNRDGGYQRRDNQGGYGARNSYSNNRPGGFNKQGRRPSPGGFNNRNNFKGGRPMNRNKAPKQLLVTKEQLEQIELLYKMMLPLPNPDAHEVIGEKIGVEPRKVFFGINLVRQKMMLPKLPFPKRKLAITPDQLFAIKNLYEPLLPLPPIGCHKIIAAQLKMDEWRVHVGIGLIRTQMGLQRWNQEREDAPEEFKNQKTSAEVKEQPSDSVASSEVVTPADEVKSEPAQQAVQVALDFSAGEDAVAEVVEKPKRGRPKKTVETEEVAE